MVLLLLLFLVIFHYLIVLFCLVFFNILLILYLIIIYLACLIFLVGFIYIFFYFYYFLTFLSCLLSFPIRRNYLFLTMLFTFIYQGLNFICFINLLIFALILKYFWIMNSLGGGNTLSHMVLLSYINLT